MDRDLVRDAPFNQFADPGQAARADDDDRCIDLDGDVHDPSPRRRIDLSSPFGKEASGPGKLRSCRQIGRAHV